MKKIVITLFLLVACFVTFVSCQKEIVCSSENEQEEMSEFEYAISAPLHYETAESLASSIWSGKMAAVKSGSSFVSYSETVMREPGYDDRSNAILSERFGSYLNAAGEVTFGDYLLKVCDYGILYAPVSMADRVRELCEDRNLLSYCGEKVRVEDINPAETFYKVDGYDGVYLYDTFNLLSAEESSLAEAVETKAISPNLVHHYLSGPQTTFTIPAPGSQKVLFSNANYCNDTKVFQQNYGFTSDGGLKTKTMKKGFLGTWSKFANPIEGGISFFTIYEWGPFENIHSSTPDINKVGYGSATKYIYSINARGTTPQEHVPAMISNLISQGNQLAQQNGLSITMDGIRFVLDDDYAVTVFCPLEDSGTYSKIDYSWPVPINGQTTGIHSYLGRTPNYGMLNYYVVGFLAYGQSTMGSEVRGSSVTYNYWQ